METEFLEFENGRILKLIITKFLVLFLKLFLSHQELPIVAKSPDRKLKAF